MTLIGALIAEIARVERMLRYFLALATLFLLPGSLGQNTDVLSLELVSMVSSVIGLSITVGIIGIHPL